MCASRMLQYPCWSVIVQHESFGSINDNQIIWEAMDPAVCFLFRRSRGSLFKVIADCAVERRFMSPQTCQFCSTSVPDGTLAHVFMASSLRAVKSFLELFSVIAEFNSLCTCILSPLQTWTGALRLFDINSDGSRHCVIIFVDFGLSARVWSLAFLANVSYNWLYCADFLFKIPNPGLCSALFGSAPHNISLPYLSRAWARKRLR